MIDSNPYFIVPMITGDKVVEAVMLAIEMAKQSYPHLAGQLQLAEDLWRKNALTFTGTEKIPSSARPAYKDGKAK